MSGKYTQPADEVDIRAFYLQHGWELETEGFWDIGRPWKEPPRCPIARGKGEAGPSPAG